MLEKLKESQEIDLHKLLILNQFASIPSISVQIDFASKSSKNTSLKFNKKINKHFHKDLVVNPKSIDFECTNKISKWNEPSFGYFEFSCEV